jgi:DNA-binding transcriptional MocR family regulator
VLEDDPYGLVRFEGDRPPTLFELDGGEQVVYSSSFSKTVAPGLRVGYFVLPQALDAELEALAVSTYITPVLLGQATVFEFLRRGNFEPNLERLRGLLRARRDAMLDALEQELPSATWSHPQAATSCGSSFRRRWGTPGVAFVPGTDFGGASNTVRLAFSYVSPDEIREGVRRLSAAVSARGEVAAAGPASRGYAT